MVFNLSVLQQHLLSKHGILPERVQWDTRLWHDLRLTDADVQSLLTDVVCLSHVLISLATTRNLTDIFDLMVFVLLRSIEERTYSPISIW